MLTNITKLLMMLLGGINTFSIIMLCGAAVGTLFAFLSSLILAIKSVKSKLDNNSQFAPPISIFKPLKGLDENLFQNLESFFLQNYSDYELIFGVNDPDDPAIEIVKILIKKYPTISVKLIVNTWNTGQNPKVNNLYNMAPFAEHDYWIISDSNVRVKASYLENIIKYMQDPSVGLVTSSIRGVGGKRLGAKLENLHLNSFISSSSIGVSSLLKIPVTIGKSMLIRRETVNHIGGFESLANYLIEDGIIGIKVQNLGLRTDICTDVVENINDNWSVRDFLSRHSRWALMRRHLNLFYYCLEIISNPGSLAFIALVLSPTTTAYKLALLIISFKFAFDLLTIYLIGGSIRISSLLLLPIKDLLITGVWLGAFFTNKVCWRGHHFRIGAMTRINPILSETNPVARISGRLLSIFVRKYRYAR